MANVEQMNKTVEKVSQATKESYGTVIDHAIGLQERNVRFVQGVADSSVKEFRQQAESNRAMTQELVERAEKQRGAFQTLVNETVDSYMNFVYAPFSYYKEGLEVAKKAVK
ncbi:MAG: hypothetical protein WA982_02040 [Rubrobacteraceae bacterium]